MSQQFRKPLLANKNTPFQRLQQQCFVILQRIKQKNDFLQRQTGTEMEETIAEVVHQQKKSLQHQIVQIRAMMDEIEVRFKDPESKNKLKSLKQEAQKQIQRNKIIMKDLITKSFVNKSRGSVDENDQNEYMETGEIHYNKFGHEQQNSIITERQEPIGVQEQVQIDYEIQRKILNEKKELLNEVEQTNLRVNAIMNDMALEVNEQGENLDVISEQLLKAHKNVAEGNQVLDEASKLQKKSRKKYVILVLLILLVVALVIGVVFLLGN